MALLALTQEQARELCDAFNISVDPDSAETEQMEIHNPRLLAAMEAIVGIARGDEAPE